MHTRRAFLCGITGLLTGSGAPPRRQRAPRPDFLRVEKTRLYLGDREFRNVGVNVPDLFERFLTGAGANMRDILRRASEAGARFVRCWGTTWGPERFRRFEKEPGQWFAAFDAMLEAVQDAGMRLVPSLLWNPHMLSGYVRQTRDRKEYIVDTLRLNSVSGELALRYVTAVVERYRDDPRVLLWEIGNEYNLEADLSRQHDRAEGRPVRADNQIPTSDDVRDFLIRIARQIKQIDRNHPITSGNADMRPAAWHLHQAMRAHRDRTDPLDFPMDWRRDSFDQYRQMLAFYNPDPLDVLSVHQYPEAGEAFGWVEWSPDQAFHLPWTRTAADIIGKPLFVGEFGQTVWADGREQEAAWTRDFLRRLEAGAAPMAAVWAWEFEPDHPEHGPRSWGAQRTPELIRQLTAVNMALNAVAGAKAGREKARIF
ncbi:MAG: cellulase family glycosylhydrolase [Chloroherpetonaceae bacterium]|nr:cellulase family glycosylhydrolase [Chthonomonadaceae bacterium]MDW8206888.1 cellulase family glycosylhydrolase [Chloroherpetonaceae bacterium]